MTLDLIIISDAKTAELQRITQHGIDTAFDGKLINGLNVIVVEGNKDVTYEYAKTVYQEGNFNYNKFLNYGASLGEAEYIAFCNNDLIYEKGWAYNLLYALRLGFDSVSPYSHISQAIHKSPHMPKTGEQAGLTVKHEFEGWCFVWRRSLWEEIKLDERISFWCSDDATVEQLKAAGKTHALVTYAFVEHTNNGGHTLKTMHNRQELTIGQAKIFNRLYDKNIENAGK